LLYDRREIGQVRVKVVARRIVGRQLDSGPNNK